jgi:membrane protease YdiL (CAAX protease family)
MIIEKYRHPFVFYGLSTTIPWAFWFAAAYLSHIAPTSQALAWAASGLGVVGLLAPVFIAWSLIRSEPGLRDDVRRRLLGLTDIRPVYLFLACFLMLASILLAQVISLPFGYSVDQFSLSGKTSFSAGIFPGWFMLIFAPLVEELAWHSYGTDCLRRRMNLFNTCLVFGVFWVVWHVPLSFIKDYYHSNVATTGLLYSLNFAFSLIPFVILMNWLYYKTNRSILIAIIFHVSAGCFNEMFATRPESKVIQTGLLLVLSVVLVIKERGFFFRMSIGDADRMAL